MCWFGVLLEGSRSQLLLGMVWFSEEGATAAVRRCQGNWYRCSRSFLTSLDPEPSLTVPEEFEREGNPSPDSP